MIGGILIRVIAVLVSAVFVGGSWATTGSVDISILRYLSIAVLVVTFALAVWNTRVWRNTIGTDAAWRDSRYWRYLGSAA